MYEIKNSFLETQIKVYQNDTSSHPSLKSIKKQYTNFIINQTGRNITAAAIILNVSRSSLYRKINR